MRRALLVGINDYPGCALKQCEDDVQRLGDVLGTHDNGDPNFTCRPIVSSAEPVTRGRLKQLIDELFAAPADAALFYFSGHGSEEKAGGVLVTQDFAPNDTGVSMEYLLAAASAATPHIKEIFIVVDCCHAGYTGHSWVVGTGEIIPRGVSILTASSEKEVAYEGVFTSLICDALLGGAADILGEVTAARVYAYLDQTLGAWEQRPHFKANLSKLEPLRYCEPAVALPTLRQIIKIFPSADHELPLSPAYEPTELPKDEAKEAIFATLQKFRAARLVVPVGEDHLYFAAKNSKSCKLTALGRFYWSLVDRNKL
jgi:hypothetical protein